MEDAMKKFGLLLLIAVTIFNVFAFAGCGEKESAFDEDNIVLSFSAMSDVHQEKGNTGNRRKLEDALDYAKELAGGKLDLALFSGDLTEHTWNLNNEDYSTSYNADIEVFKEAVLNALDLDETPVFYSLGNHETETQKRPKEIMSQMPGLFQSMLGEDFFKIDTENSQISKGRRHAIIKGYHFIAVQPDEYWVPRGYSQETLSWLKNVLDEAVQDSPDRFIFLSAHPGLYGTVFGTFTHRYYDMDIHELLEDYPQVVYLGGHMHNVLQDECQISQNGYYTALDCGSVKCSSSMNTLNSLIGTFDNSVGLRYDDFSQGLLLQVDKNGNLKITRCDYINRRTIKQAWYIPSPKQDKSHLKAYDNETRIEKNIAPRFQKGASISATRDGNGYTIAWDSAYDDDMVRYYKIEVLKRENGNMNKVETVYFGTMTYLYQSQEEMPKRFEYFYQTDEEGLEFNCTAFDVWQEGSDTISTY